MSKLMYVFGIILLAIGAALALVSFINPAQLQVRGLTMDTAALLIVGGVLSLGLGGVITALGGAELQSPSEAAGASRDAAAGDTASDTAKTKFPSFSRKGSETKKAAAATAAAAATTSSSVQETISALEQAKSEIESAVGGRGDPVDTVGSAETQDGELYVVEDKVVRGRPARILSDGTVEAETDEGWMRFENLEHLDEYLDAVSSPET